MATIQPTTLVNLAEKRYEREDIKYASFQDLYVNSEYEDAGKIHPIKLYLKDMVLADGSAVNSIDTFWSRIDEIKYDKEPDSLKGKSMKELGITVNDVMWNNFVQTDRFSNPNLDARVKDGCQRTLILNPCARATSRRDVRLYESGSLCRAVLNHTSDTRLIPLNRLYYIKDGEPQLLSGVITNGFAGFRGYYPEIFYIENESEFRKARLDYTRDKRAGVENVSFNYVGIPVKNIDLTNVYENEAGIFSYEAKTNGLIKSYELTEMVDEDGNPILDESGAVKTEFKEVSSRSTIDMFVDKTPFQVSGEGKDKKYLIKNKLYARNDNGTFIAVQVKGQSFMQKVKLADVYDADKKPIFTEDFYLARWYGKELLIKEGDTFKSIEPLTVNNERYDEQKVLQAMTGSEGIMTEGAYLRLKKGKLMPETEDNIKPKAYIAVDDSTIDNNVDAYLIETSDNKKLIVDKEFFRKNNLSNGKTTTYNGVSITITGVLKLQRSTVANATVIQTTSTKGDNFNACKVVGKVVFRGVDRLDVDKKDDGTDVDKAEVVNDFIEYYKTGKYELDKVEVGADDDPSLVDIDVRNDSCRYVYSSEFVTEDTTATKGVYAAMNGQALKIETNPDGTISFAKTDAKYDASKAIKSDYKNLRGLAVNFAGLFSTGGAALILVAPWLVIGAAAAAVVAIPGIPIYENIKAAYKNATNLNQDKMLNQMDKVNDLNDDIVKGLEEELPDVYNQTIQQINNIEKTVDADIAKAIADAEKNINAMSISNEEKEIAKQNARNTILGSKNARIQALQEELTLKLETACDENMTKIHTLASSNMEGTSFTVKDGKGVIHGYNAINVVNFKREFNDKVEARNELQKELKGLDEKKKELDEILAKEAKGKKLSGREQRRKQKIEEEILLVAERVIPGKSFANTEDRMVALKNELSTRNGELESLKNSFESGNYVSPADKNHDRLRDNLYTMEAFLQTKINPKKFVEEAFPIEDGMTEDEKTAVRIKRENAVEAYKNLNYDVVTGKFYMGTKTKKQFTMEELNELSAKSGEEFAKGCKKLGVKPGYIVSLAPMITEEGLVGLEEKKEAVILSKGEIKNHRLASEPITPEIVVEEKIDEGKGKKGTNVVDEEIITVPKFTDVPLEEDDLETGVPLEGDDDLDEEEEHATIIDKESFTNLEKNINGIINYYETLILKYKQDLESKGLTIEELNNKIAELENQINEAKDKIEKGTITDEERSKATEQESLLNQYRELKEAYDSVLEEKTGLEKELEELRALVKDINDGKDVAPEDWKSKYDQLQTRLNNISNKHAKEITEKNNKIKALEDENKSLLERINKLQDEISKDPEINSKKYEKLENELEEARKKLSDNEKEIQELNNEKNNLIAEREYLQNRIAELEQNVEDAKKKISALEGEKQSLNQKIKEKDEEIVKLTGERDKAIEDKNKAIEDKNEAEKELTKRKKEIDDKTKNINDLEARNKELDGKNEELEINIQALKAEREDLRKQFNALLDDRNKLVGDVESAERTIKEKDAQIEDLNKDVEKLKEQIKEIEKEKKALEEEKKKDFEAQKARYEAEVKKLDENLKKVEERINSIRAIITSLEKERDNLQAKIDALVDRTNKVEVVGLNEEIKSLQTRILNNQDSINRLSIILRGEDMTIGLCEQANDVLLRYEKDGIDKKLGVRQRNKDRVNFANKLDKKTESLAIDNSAIGIDQVILEKGKTDNTKSKKEFDPVINSEQALLDRLTEQLDPVLIDYLYDNITGLTQKDIDAAIDRLINKHEEGKSALSGTTRLKNQNIAKVLTIGQKYLTTVAKYNPNDDLLA